MDLRLIDVRKQFDDHLAIDGVSLDVASGELVALLGPSGSGKTTLLRLIAGLEFPDAGAIFFGDEDASQKSVRERHVGMVFQHYALFKHMSVLDNVCFGLRVRKRHERPTASEIRKAARNLLDLVQLSGLENRFPAQLSGGQRQRVALARALAIEPRLLLLDEPFGALDAKVRRELRRWLREIHDRTGHTTLFVTHDQEEALELADRIVVMNASRIEQVGTADEIYDRPATPYVFGFIGESTALPVELRNDRVWLDGVDTGLWPAHPPTRQRPADGPAWLYFRPHDIAVEPGGEGGLAGAIVSTRRHGPVRRAEIAVGRDGHRIEFDLAADAHGADGARIGPGVQVALRPRAWTVYPAN